MPVPGKMLLPYLTAVKGEAAGLYHKSTSTHADELHHGKKKSRVNSGPFGYITAP